MRTFGSHHPFDKSALPGGVPDALPSAQANPLLDLGAQTNIASKNPSAFNVKLANDSQTATGFTATMDDDKGGKWKVDSASKKNSTQVSVVHVRPPATNETCTMTFQDGGWHCAYVDNNTGTSRLYDLSGSKKIPPEISPFIEKAHDAALAAAAMKKEIGEQHKQELKGNIPTDASPSKGDSTEIIHGLKELQKLRSLPIAAAEGHGPHGDAHGVSLHARAPRPHLAIPH